MDLERLELGGYDTSFQALVLKWYEAHTLIQTHQQDAQNRQMEKRSKRNRGRRPRRRGGRRF